MFRTEGDSNDSDNNNGKYALYCVVQNDSRMKSVCVRLLFLYRCLFCFPFLCFYLLVTHALQKPFVSWVCVFRYFTPFSMKIKENRLKHAFPFWLFVCFFIHIFTLLSLFFFLYVCCDATHKTHNLYCILDELRVDKLLIWNGHNKRLFSWIELTWN